MTRVGSQRHSKRKVKDLILLRSLTIKLIFNYYCILFYVTYWSADEQPVAETCSHVIYIETKKFNGNCILNYDI
jgi:hypothetical protein